jgi:hypothetical protein
LEKRGGQVGHRFHIVFGLVGTLALVSIHRFLEQATGLLEVSKTSVNTPEPIHSEQCRRVVAPQGFGANSQDMLEMREGLSVPTESLEDESLKLLGFKRAWIVHTQLKSERRHDLTPELQCFIESTRAFQ